MVVVTFSDLQRDAAAAIADHEARGRRIDQFAAAIPGFKPEHRANLLGSFPTWAHYVLSLGEAGHVVTRSQAEVSLGSARNIRAFALRLLEIADEIAPVEVPQ